MNNTHLKSAAKQMILSLTAEYASESHYCLILGSFDLTCFGWPKFRIIIQKSMTWETGVLRNKSVFYLYFQYIVRVQASGEARFAIRI